MKFTKTLKTLTASALLLALSSNAQAAFKSFTVDEDFTAGESLVQADKLNGGYTEMITVAGDLSFEVSAFATFSQLFNDGVALVTDIGSEYRLYAVFSSAGQVVPAAPNPFGVLASLNGFSGAFDLFLDRNLDTTGTLGANAAAGVTLGNTADDSLIAFSNTSSGTGLATTSGGFFDILFSDFTLTPAGAEYFVAPDPFYVKATVDGDFDTFSVAPGSQELTGDVSAVFVPEPSSLAILGLGLFGLGFTARRKASAK